MIVMMKRIVLVAVSFLLVYGYDAYGGFKAKNVVIVVGDEFRHDETFGDRSHQYIPRIWNDMVPNGAHCVTFYGNPSYLVRVHLAILTGSWNDVRRLKPQDYPDLPTMFEYYRKGLGKDKNSCYYITSKPEFNFMNYSNHEQYGEDFGATAEYTKQKNNDEELYEKLVANMKKNRPSLVVAILGGANSYNKKKKPEEVELYRKQVKAMDNVVYKIWQAIQSDPNYKDQTEFFFINDHGNLLDHAECDDECKRYWICLALGPDVKKKFSTENKWRQINICPTVGKILNFPTPLVAKDAAPITDFFLP
jgi:hypothetical protein